MSVRAIVAASVACLLSLVAERLPIRSYTIADGLPSDQVNGIVADSRGFTWFLTPEGLSRFDGYRFTNFGIEEGLPHRVVQAFLETRDGTYLAATPRGLGLLRKGLGKGQFVTFHPGTSPSENFVTALIQSSSGKIWCGTYHGLFEVTGNSKDGFKFRPQPLPDPPPGWKGIEISDIAEDACGKLWLATTSGIYVVGTDGAVLNITKQEGLPGDVVNTVFAAKDGRLWAGVRGGLTLMNNGCTDGSASVGRVYPPEIGRDVVAIAEGSDGALWVGNTTDGITRLLRGGGSVHMSRVQGLVDRAVLALASDKAGNTWAGTEGAGVMKIQPTGFTTFREQDGLPSDRVWSVFEDNAGKLVTVTGSEDQTQWGLGIFDGIGAHSRFQPLLGPRVFAEYRTWGSDRILLQSRHGEWWGASQRGLCRYAPVNAESLANKSPEQCYVPDETIFQIFEDSKGGIWASAQSPGGDRLMRWDPVTKSLVKFEEWPRQNALMRAFAEDRKGNVWMGAWGAGGMYCHDGQHFKHFTATEGIPDGTISSLLVDSLGRIWVAGASGLGLIEDPGAVPFKFRLYNRSNGLSSNTVRGVLEDKQGYIYAATGTGVDRLDVKSGHIKHFTSADGLALGVTESVLRDRDGNLWFATTQGLSRLTPGNARPSLNPSILITGLRAGGTLFPVEQRGETAISGIELEPSKNQLQIEFVAFDQEAEDNLRYAYKLDGADSGWSFLHAQHTVDYAALASGKYRFLVKATNSDGLESPPAEVSFVVLPPVWRRWWFEGLALMALTAIVYTLHSYRVSHMVSLEKMRTTIATDLHDDIGASLSQIAILSEVARSQVSREDRLPQESLLRVGSLARELVDSMSDIVWAIRTEPDGLDSLSQRMREFALDLLVSQGIAFDLRTPQARESAALNLHIRRQLFLMFKECIHNASRHSGCTAVRAELKTADGDVTLIVEDNGRGLANPPGPNGGSGIPGMMHRAQALGGKIQFDSKTDSGCRVSIRLPLRRGVFAKESA